MLAALRCNSSRQKSSLAPLMPSEFHPQAVGRISRIIGALPGRGLACSVAEKLCIFYDLRIDMMQCTEGDQGDFFQLQIGSLCLCFLLPREQSVLLVTLIAIDHCKVADPVQKALDRAGGVALGGTSGCQTVSARPNSSIVTKCPQDRNGLEADWSPPLHWFLSVRDPEHRSVQGRVPTSCLKSSGAGSSVPWLSFSWCRHNGLRH